MSTIGLETYLGVTALVGVARYAVAGRPLATGVLCGLAVLTRPDLAVPAGVLVLGLVAWRRWPVVAVVGAAVALPWHLFSWFRLGGFLPDTVWFKSGDHWGEYTFTNGWAHYAVVAPAATVLVLLPVVAGFLAVGWWLLTRYRHPARRLALVFATAGAAHWVAFAALGTAPYPWYLAPSAVCLTVTAAVTVAALRWQRAAAEMVGAVLVSCAVFLGSWHWYWGPLNANWGTAQQYAAVGHGVAAITGGQEVLIRYEVGTPAFLLPLSDGRMVRRPRPDRPAHRRSGGERRAGTRSPDAVELRAPQAHPTSTAPVGAGARQVGCGGGQLADWRDGRSASDVGVADPSRAGETALSRRSKPRAR